MIARNQSKCLIVLLLLTIILCSCRNNNVKVINQTITLFSLTEELYKIDNSLEISEEIRASIGGLDIEQQLLESNNEQLIDFYFSHSVSNSMGGFIYFPLHTRNETKLFVLDKETGTYSTCKKMIYSGISQSFVMFPSETACFITGNGTLGMINIPTESIRLSQKDVIASIDLEITIWND